MPVTGSMLGAVEKVRPPVVPVGVKTKVNNWPASLAGPGLTFETKLATV